MSIVITDALGLISIIETVPPSQHRRVLEGLTESIEQDHLQFPREVADELMLLCREEIPLWGWVIGLGDRRDRHRPDTIFGRPMMNAVVELGFQSGFATLDNHDPEIFYVGKLAFEREHQSVPFAVLTGDSGTHPLRPTMEQLCSHAGWQTLTVSECLTDLGIDP